MKKSIVILLFLITFGTKAQGNLQFNRVVVLTAGSNYTVPANKVLKIESISTNGSTVCIPKTSSSTGYCSIPNFYGQYTFGIYDSIIYITIANISYKTASAYGGTGNCATAFNDDCHNVSVDTIQIPTPLWLDSGKNINIYNDPNFQILISAIEFNVVP